jgi:hypothetical protein
LPEEEVLAGGNLSRVVRVGETVRRPTGPWTPTVHALLRHLEAARFDGAPRVLGIDDEGREILELIPGPMAWPEMGPLASDDGLARAANLLRRYHEAVAGFVVPDDAEWQFPDMEADAQPYLGGESPIVCHNDCAAWNLVIGDDRWAFIDWDVAGPRPRLWDVAYAIRGMVLCDRTSALRDRVELFCREYGLDVTERRRLPEIVFARIQSSIDLMRRGAEAGTEPWVTMWAGDHRASWESILVLARQVLA